MMSFHDISPYDFLRHFDDDARCAAVMLRAVIDYDDYFFAAMP